MPDSLITVPIATEPRGVLRNLAQDAMHGYLWNLTLGQWDPPLVGAGLIGTDYFLTQAQHGDMASWQFWVPEVAGTQVQAEIHDSVTPEIDRDPVAVYSRINALVPDPMPVELPQNQTPVPKHRTSKLVYKAGEGLTSETPRIADYGHRQLFSVDFTSDLPVGGRVEEILLVRVDPSGEPGNATIEAAGVDRVFAKIWITGLAIGRITCTVRIRQMGSGHISDAKVHYDIVDQPGEPTPP